jgi:hypothetical protein
MLHQLVHIITTVVKRIKGSKYKHIFCPSTAESNKVCFLLYGQLTDKINIYIFDI